MLYMYAYIYIIYIYFDEKKSGDWRRKLRKWNLAHTNDEIGVAVPNWLWVWVEAMAWWLSRASERNSVVVGSNPAQAKQLSIATSNNPSVVNTIYIHIYIYINIYIYISYPYCLFYSYITLSFSEKRMNGVRPLFRITNKFDWKYLLSDEVRKS